MKQERSPSSVKKIHLNFHPSSPISKEEKKKTNSKKGSIYSSDLSPSVSRVKARLGDDVLTQTHTQILHFVHPYGKHMFSMQLCFSPLIGFTCALIDEAQSLHICFSCCWKQRFDI